ncbi:2-C-methyl-D-erythritol 4-phosphate cytidylyltransferase [Microbacterium gorillae]|uniref:2-C-methyl-D-erythritol 4-phosphate cytidylyltransferase n=1 Tax=Microbacterium gorillae TaxID=1231063 RepID=UPI003D99C54D
MDYIPVPRVAVVIVAAGAGTRLGAGEPKAFVGLDDRTILAHALDGVLTVPTPMQIVVVAPANRVGEATAELDVRAGERRHLASVVVGGDTRQASVAAGLAALWGDIEVVLVHDAARALTPPEVFERVIAAVDETGWGIIPVIPVVDTLKRVDGARITAAVDRAELAAAQTPQGFRRDVLVTSYAAAGEEFTDDAALLQSQGHTVGTVAGDELSFKITTPADLERARQLVAPSSAGTSLSGTVQRARQVTPRVGIGTDVHAFTDQGTLWLAGLEWPGESALEGHSDGDAVAHAIVDALLSAAGLGDIGAHFGTARPEFAGAHGAAFLAETRRIVERAGFRIGNVAVQVQAARPKFAPRRAEAEQVLSDVLGAPVSVSATTTDGLGFVGAAEGVQAFAVAMLVAA